MPAATATKAAESRSSSAAGAEAVAAAAAATAAMSVQAGQGQATQPQNEALRQVLNVIDKKVRNMEKKKVGVNRGPAAAQEASAFTQKENESESLNPWIDNFPISMS